MEFEDLPPAGDYTAYNRVVTKERPPSDFNLKKPGSVEVQPLLLPGIVAFSALAAAGIPVLLSPGQTAFEAQRTASGKGDKLEGKVRKEGGNNLFR